MIRYKLYQNNNKAMEDCYGKWYARVCIDETYDLEQLSQHMADHNTPYSAGTINGVLTDMVSCIKELLLDGKGVKLDGLAIFSIGVRSTGAETAEEFTTAGNITGVKLRARAIDDFMSTELVRDAEKHHVDEYTIEAAVDDEEEAEDDSDGDGLDIGDSEVYDDSEEYDND